MRLGSWRAGEEDQRTPSRGVIYWTFDYLERKPSCGSVEVGSLPTGEVLRGLRRSVVHACDGRNDGNNAQRRRLLIVGRQREDAYEGNCPGAWIEFVREIIVRGKTSVTQRLDESCYAPLKILNV